MQTRCLTCGNLMDGLAQLCADCEAKERARAEASRTGDDATSPELAPAAGIGATGLIVAAVSVCMVAGFAVWVFALGGAATLGLEDVSDSGREAVLATDTATPATSLASLGYERADCEFEVPDGAEAECGYLTVPESRADPHRGRVRLPVAVFKSLSDAPAPDPIVFLDGGPGGNTLERLDFFYLLAEPLLQTRDLIVFDQRGAGYSEPSLDCPEISDVNFDHLIRQFSVNERVRQAAGSAGDCYERLVEEGVNPALATSAENAADVNDLRLALGYDQWNLYGVSYGTRLALTVMRDFPDGVRSAILDSVYPPQSDLYGEYMAGFDRALNALFEACAGDIACNEAYPDLEAAFYETIDRLNEVPVQFSIGSVTGRPLSTATIDGIWFGGFVFASLYSEALIPLLPKMIFDTRDHEYDLLKVIADFYLQDSESISYGMYLSIQCGEEVPFADRETVIATAEEHPRQPAFSEYSARSIFAICDEWDAPPASETENAAVTSAVPALVLAGEFDPITPPAWGRLAAETLENSFFYEFPGLGHGVALAGECPSTITLAFLDNPAGEPPGGCVAQMGVLFWLSPF